MSNCQTVAPSSLVPKVKALKQCLSKVALLYVIVAR